MAEETKSYSIYAIRCKVNGRIYIGVTADVQTRVHQHFLELKRREKVKQSNVDHHQTGVEWQADYDEYGEEAFEVYVLEENIAHDARHARETHWIRKYDTMNPQNGYNVKPSQKKVHAIIAGLPPMPKTVEAGDQ
jgi:group I intron endonuclease